MGTIKTLRASGTSLRAEVAIGKNKYGGDVTVNVEVRRSDPEVAASLEVLTSLLSTRAEAFVVEAGIEAQVQERVRDQVEDKVKDARVRAQKNADQRVLTLVETLERYLGGEEVLQPWQVTRLRTAVREAKDLVKVESKEAQAS